MTDGIDVADDPRAIVAAGYDAIAERYYAWSDARPSATRLRWLAKALERGSRPAPMSSTSAAVPACR